MRRRIDSLIGSRMHGGELGWLGILVSCAALLHGCAASAPLAVDKAAAREAEGRGEDGEDLCELAGWYGDGECDDFCARHDSDCLECEGENPEGCRSSGCEPGYRCDTTTEGASSGCWCDGATGTWTCLPDVGGGVCVPETVACEEPNPQGCVSGGCPDGQVCDTSAGTAPTSCTCDESRGIWACTPDVSGGVCVTADPGSCEGPNPAGCVSTGCPEGQHCDTSVGARSSACTCHPPYWACTPDASGGECVPD